MSHTIYLLLGSNVGDRIENLEYACRLIKNQLSPTIIRSHTFETAAWGKTDQAPFINQAILIQTNAEPLDLLAILKTIEKEVGRVDTEKWGPRVIDIDILLYDRDIIQDPILQIPHPYLPVRRFALLPLSEIVADLIHPVLKKTIKELLSECPDESEVKLYA